MESCGFSSKLAAGCGRFAAGCGKFAVEFDWISLDSYGFSLKLAAGRGRFAAGRGKFVLEFRWNPTDCHQNLVRGATDLPRGAANWHWNSVGWDPADFH